MKRVRLNDKWFLLVRRWPSRDYELVSYDDGSVRFVEEGSWDEEEELTDAVDDRAVGFKDRPRSFLADLRDKRLEAFRAFVRDGRRKVGSKPRTSKSRTSKSPDLSSLSPEVRKLIEGLPEDKRAEVLKTLTGRKS
jgi:hypothetical protein